jgi:hypothetical protein
VRSFLFVVVLLLLPAAHVRAQGSAAYEGPPSLPRVMRNAIGEWDWSGDSLTCKHNPHTVDFTNDSAFMVLRFRRKIDSTAKLEYRYRILRFTDHTVTGQIEGEQRRDSAGKPVVWDLVLTGPNSYRWRQTGGLPQAVTRAIVRCRNGVPLSEAE